MLKKIYSSIFSKEQRVKLKYYKNKFFNSSRKPSITGKIDSKAYEKFVKNELLDIGSNKNIIRIGEYYLDKSLINSQSIVYSFGIFEDVFFELNLSVEYNCKCYLFDPDPRDLIFFNKHYSDYNLFEFMPVGVWTEEKKIRFRRPKHNGSASAVFNYLDSAFEFEALVLPIKKIMKKYNHEKIDILKMDIEGVVPDILKDLLKNKLLPKQIVIEWENFNTETEQEIIQFFNEVKVILDEFKNLGFSIYYLPRANYLKGIELLFVRNY